MFRNKKMIDDNYIAISDQEFMDALGLNEKEVEEMLKGLKRKGVIGFVTTVEEEEE